MPERSITFHPTTIVGSPTYSGDVNTGQVLNTLGGTKTFTSFSGTAGGDALIHKGGGRLDAAFFLDTALIALSGQPVVFYDAAVAVSGGPLAASGHKVCGVLAPSPTEGALTSISGNALRGGNVRQIGFTFQSGLCYSSRSGAGGFTASYTPVYSG